MTPESKNSEKALLGTILRFPTALFGADNITADAFFYEAHQILFRRISQIVYDGRELDLVILRHILLEKGEIEKAGGEAYLMELVDHGHRPENARHYAEIVRGHYLARQVQAAAQKVANNGMEISEAISTMQRVIDLVQAAAGTEVLDAPALAADHSDHMDAVRGNRGITGMQTGLTLFDSLTRGLQPEEMSVWSGAPGMGKTGAAVTLIRNMPDKRIGMFSMEQGRTAIMNRIVAATTGLDLADLRDGRLDPAQWKRAYSALGELRARGESLWICDAPGLTIDQIIAECRKRKEQHGLDLLILDYFTMIRHNVDRKSAQLHEIYKDLSTRLKQLARKLKIHVMVIAQIKADVAPYTEPTIFALGETRQLAYDADLEVYLWQRKGKIVDTFDDMLTVAKNRNGATGKVQVYFRRPSASYENLERSYQ